MSVRSDKRSESSVEFINTAHELEVLTIKLTMRENAIPKRYRYILGQPLCEATRRLNAYIIYANSIYPKSKEEYQRRRSFQESAWMELKNIFELMRITTELLPMKNTVATEWVNMAYREERVLKKWMESDKQRFKEL